MEITAPPGKKITGNTHKFHESLFTSPDSFYFKGCFFFETYESPRYLENGGMVQIYRHNFCVGDTRYKPHPNDGYSNRIIHFLRYETSELDQLVGTTTTKQNHGLEEGILKDILRVATNVGETELRVKLRPNKEKKEPEQVVADEDETLLNDLKPNKASSPKPSAAKVPLGNCIEPEEKKDLLFHAGAAAGEGGEEEGGCWPAAVKEVNESLKNLKQTQSVMSNKKWQMERKDELFQKSILEWQNIISTFALKTK